MIDYEVPKRVIPCFDMQDGRVVKGQHFTDMQDAGDPVSLARQYEAGGADELIFLDITATTEKRATVTDLARSISEAAFIPFTIGGGIRSVADAQAVLDSGADKVAVNSAALKRPELVTELAQHIGQQSVVVAIDAKRSPHGTTWEAYAAGGKQATGKDAIAWAKEAVERGAGEILFTSMDRDGTNDGYDLEVQQKVAQVVNVPIIASGGAGRVEDCSAVIQEGMADAALCASIFHRGEVSVADVKDHFMEQGIPIRPIDDRTITDYQVVETTEAKPRIAIIDYGMGNRLSVASALTLVGGEAVITNDPEEIAAADGIVLPGVGSFPAAMEHLEEQNLIDPLNAFRLSGKPVLGICLGAQLLFESSEEHTATKGLGWIGGNVTRINSAVSPNIGWRYVDLPRPSALTQNIDSGDLFYHAHQFAAQPNPRDRVKGLTRLGRTTAGQASWAVGIVNHGALYGTQFHPEKSSYSGLGVLKNYVAICRVTD
jgi:cyclase